MNIYKLRSGFPVFHLLWGREEKRQPAWVMRTVPFLILIVTGLAIGCFKNLIVNASSLMGQRWERQSGFVNDTFYGL